MFLPGGLESLTLSSDPRTLLTLMWNTEEIDASDASKRYDETGEVGRGVNIIKSHAIRGCASCRCYLSKRTMFGRNPTNGGESNASVFSPIWIHSDMDTRLESPLFELEERVLKGRG
ncbi:hypothetical protein CDAR_217661 [Caerostris darwini]|uniref:Uncharacterized protein n=1 Tax=Caerostris darwini TaxID=1538125 RepID=A0AAV4U9E8_9ARAC|nr:hypothetical protein CDAR_217661 [Caerostris darwini]